MFIGGLLEKYYVKGDNDFFLHHIILTYKTSALVLFRTLY